MSSRTIKKLLLSLVVVGLLGSFTARGTYALLNGEARNPNDQLASGTLLMDNSVYGGAQQPCSSKSVSLNVNTGCDSIFTSGLLYPIPTASEPPLPATSTYVYGDVTITNSGTLPATLSIYMPNCTPGTTNGYPGASWTAINPCGSLDLFIQEYTGGLPAPEGSGTATSSCAWPASTSAACTFVDASLGGFDSQYYDNTHYLSLGSIAGGASRYFRIAVAEPGDASNGLQGQTATFAIYWHME
jgi:hypothetical protein